MAVITKSRLVAAITALLAAAVAVLAAPSPATADDPAFPSNWRNFRFLVQDPNNHARWAMDVYFSGGHGTQVQLWDQNWGMAQKWYEEPAAEGGSYLHPAYNRWLCLGANGTHRGSPLMVQNCTGHSDQRFRIIWGGVGGAMREIRSVNNNRCVDVQYSQFRAGTPLWLWDCWNFAEASQRWIRPAPDRDNSRNEPVYFVHGFAENAVHNCDAYWNDAINWMRSSGFSGTFHKVGYYQGDWSNCDTRIAEGNQNTGLGMLAQQLAWHIYNNYSSKNISVDLVGHSMGGLIIRATVNGVRNGIAEGDGSWPPFLYVEDAVTLGTPHDGAFPANLCQSVWAQCEDMDAESSFITWLSQSENPQSTQGTDWTVIGTQDDGVVGLSSAMGMDGAGHKHRYYAFQDLCHMCMLHHTAPTGYRFLGWNWQDGGPGDVSNGYSPIALATNSLYYWSNW